LADATIAVGPSLVAAASRIGTGINLLHAAQEINANGVAIMRMNNRWKRRCRRWLTRSAYSMLALISAVPYAVAGDLIQTVSGLWVPATALSLTLVTAVVRSQK
jgi:hypothetical protein